jgi:alkylation response protein AidB-like acyl-CoA dehydrogenase
MNFEFSPQQLELRASIADFAEHVVGSHVEELESGNFPAALWRAYQEAGYLSRTVPEDYGGQGAPFIDMVLMLEEIAKAHPTAAAYLQAGANFSIEFLSRLGSEHLKKKYLPEIMAGKSVLVQALSEPGAGSALTDLRTTAIRNGNTYVVNGLKHYITFGYAATGMVTFARFYPDSKGANGIGALIVDSETPGYSCLRKQPNLSAPNGSEAVMRLENCVVPAENVLVQPNRGDSTGFAKLITAYNSQRVGNAAICLGVAQRALQLAVDHARNRRQFDRPIAEFQVIQHYIAEMAAKIEAARWLIYRAAVNAGKTSHGLPLGEDAAYAKYTANQMVFEVSDRALQIFGGAGYVDNSEIGKLFLFARGESIAGGTIEMQKNLIAASVLGRKFSQRAGAAT